MKRLIYQELLNWKYNPNRKPLLLQGARQVGKTYLVEQFGKNEYDDYIYFNLEEEPDLALLFQGSLKAQTLLENMSLFIGRKINPENTLIFFDEVQVVPEAITSLKYFYEQLPQYHIIAAGSLLGVSVGRHSSFPVGKVSFLTLYPMNFIEYLMAFDEDLLAESIQSNSEITPFSEIVHNKLLNHLKKYFFMGGMPEVLKSYLTSGDISLVRKTQNEILESYERDFSKYTQSKVSIKISEVWHSIPYQLARENKKFKFKDIRKNARAPMYEHTIEWLRKAGLINIAYNISVPKLPLSGYSDLSKFKIYLLDNGLLGAMLDLSPDIIIKPEKLFQEYNGAFIENYVASELINQNYKLFYWTSKSDAEVDFVLQLKNEVYPIEVKSGKSRNIKSLKSYAAKYNPKVIIRVSPRNYYQDNNFINIPLYSVFNLKKILENLKIQ